MNRQQRRAAARKVRKDARQSFYDLAQNWPRTDSVDLSPGSMNNIFVMHAPTCPMPDCGDESMCNCNPEFEIYKQPRLQ
jgi:hypothetical protein